MSNIDRAAKVIYDTLNGQYGDFLFPTDAAQALADAGLLAPDLPAPDECPPDIHKPGWQLGGNKYAAVLAGNIHISDRYGWGQSYNPEEVRRAAYSLLAAAEYAEGGRE